MSLAKQWPPRDANALAFPGFALLAYQLPPRRSSWPSPPSLTDGHCGMRTPLYFLLPDNEHSGMQTHGGYPLPHRWITNDHRGGLLGVLRHRLMIFTATALPQASTLAFMLLGLFF